MKCLPLFLILIFTSCFLKEEKPQLTFVESSLLANSVSISLPTFKEGFPFIAFDSVTYVNIYILNDSVIQVNDSLFELEETEDALFFLQKTLKLIPIHLVILVILNQF